MKIKVNGGQFFAEGFPIRKGFTIKEGGSMLLSCLSPQGTGCARMQLLGGEVTLEEGGIEFLRWQGGGELRPAPHCGLHPTLKRQTFSEKNFFLEVSARTICRTELSLEGKSSLRHECPLPLSDPSFEIITGQRERILSVRAACFGGEYIAFFSLGEKGYRLLLEDYGDEVICLGNEVTVTKECSDLKKRQIISHHLWRGDHFDCSREYVCANVQSFIKEQSGRLLLEALLAADEQDALSYLAPDLKDLPALRRYFGSYQAVRAPLFEASPTAVAIERREEGVLRALLYDFDFDSQGMIRNIRCAEEEG